MLTREPQVAITRLGFHIFNALCIIIVFWKLGGTSQEEIQSFAGSVFYWSDQMVCTNLFAVSLVFQTERPVYIREILQKTYTPATYFLAKNIFDFFAILASTVSSIVIIYWAVGYSHERAREEFWKIFLLALLL